LSEHRPHRVAGPYPDLLHRGRPTIGDGGRDQREIRADVVGPLEHRTGLATTGVHLREPVQDGGGADTQAQIPGHRTNQIAGLQRRRLAQQPGQQVQLAPLRTLPGRGGDLVQRVEHHPHLQAPRPCRQQPLGRQAEITGRTRLRQRLLAGHAGGLAHRPGGQPLGQADVHPGEVRRDPPLAQQHHRRQQLGRRLRDEPGDAVDHRQTGGRPFEILVRLGEDFVPHRHLRTARSCVPGRADPQSRAFLGAHIQASPDDLWLGRA
jgi:hypothetical protein